MKKILLAVILILSGIFLSCSREEPFVAPAPPPPHHLMYRSMKYIRVVLNADWIEIYNPTTPTDLSGFKIYDRVDKLEVNRKKNFHQAPSFLQMGFLLLLLMILLIVDLDYHHPGKQCG